MSGRTVWSNFGEDEQPEEVSILEQEEDPGLTVNQLEIETGIDLTDLYRDMHDY